MPPTDAEREAAGRAHARRCESSNHSVGPPYASEPCAWCYSVVDAVLEAAEAVRPQAEEGVVVLDGKRYRVERRGPGVSGGAWDDYLAGLVPVEDTKETDDAN